MGRSFPYSGTIWDIMGLYGRQWATPAILWVFARLGLVLPTEAQWEYACRAGTITPFSFGETIATLQANYHGGYTYAHGQKGKYREKTVPVGTLSPNAWGLYDMHGNVSEWCLDWFGDYLSGTHVDPVGPASGSFIVSRGGCWKLGADRCCSASRSMNATDNRNGTRGFRIVLSYPIAPAKKDW